MAQIVTRVNLSAMAFPFLSEQSGRSIIVKQTDQNYVAQVTSKEDLDKDIGIPALYYCHNIIATSQGYEAIDYSQLVAPVEGATDFKAVFPVIDAELGLKAYIAYTEAGTVYYSADPYYSWVDLGNVPTFARKVITTAYVNGITYIYVANVGCYKFDFVLHQLVAVTLTELDPTKILGIVAVQGYMLAWSSAAIAWSSLLDPTDFTPSLSTGAGGGAVQGAKGDIVACVSHTIGLVIYTNQNAVAAPTSGNTRYPFNFRELVASGGLASLDLVTYDANSGNHYAYTTSGLQLISLTQTQTAIPELTDFLAGSVFEDFDEITDTFTVTHLATTLKKKLTLVSDRYLCISYGITQYTHALIYDLALKRWSKLKRTHTQIFEFALLGAEVVETPRRSIALLNVDGSVEVVRIDSRNLGANGVVLLGKYQYIRQRFTTLQSVELENVPEEGEFSVTDMYSLDGKNLIPKAGYLLNSSGLFRKYLFHATGLNHSLLLKGAFNLCSLVISTTVHGRR